MWNPIKEEETAIKERSQLSRERIMKERPILFNTEMVKAVLAGRKTQTRRVVKHDHPHFGSVEKFNHVQGTIWEAIFDDSSGINLCCPYGQVGDRFWIRETFYATHIDEKSTKDHGQIYYKADENPHVAVSWKPSIHMPRWASRINLEITNIRVERLKEISEEDAIKEGTTALTTYRDSDNIEKPDYKAGFQILWDMINEKRGYVWKANPWVWVVEFKVI